MPAMSFVSHITAWMAAQLPWVRRKAARTEWLEHCARLRKAGCDLREVYPELWAARDAQRELREARAKLGIAPKRRRKPATADSVKPTPKPRLPRLRLERVTAPATPAPVPAHLADDVWSLEALCAVASALVREGNARDELAKLRAEAVADAGVPVRKTRPAGACQRRGAPLRDVHSRGEAHSREPPADGAPPCGQLHNIVADGEDAVAVGLGRPHS